MTICLIEGCTNRPHGKGLCSSHYHRLCRYGDPLAGGTFVRERREFFLKALVYAGDECTIWPFPNPGNVGTVTIAMDGRRERVTRLLCEMAHGAPPSPIFEAAHSCGNGHLACITPKHLRWATHAENMKDMVEHGRSTRGARARSTKLTESAVRQIRRDHPVKKPSAVGEGTPRRALHHLRDHERKVMGVAGRRGLSGRSGSEPSRRLSGSSDGKRKGR